MSRQPARGFSLDRGFSLMEIVVALALAAIVIALVGSLFVASLSTWRRGSDMREAQVQAGLLVDLIARDVRNASQAPSVTIRPRLAVEEGEPVLSVAAAPVAGSGGPGDQAIWVLYLHLPDRREVVRQTVVPGPAGRVTARDSRVVATGVESITVEQSGSGVVIEVEIRRGRDVARSRATAAPRNP